MHVSWRLVGAHYCIGLGREKTLSQTLAQNSVFRGGSPALSPMEASECTRPMSSRYRDAKLPLSRIPIRTYHQCLRISVPFAEMTSLQWAMHVSSASSTVVVEPRQPNRILLCRSNASAAMIRLAVLYHSPTTPSLTSS